MGPRRRSLLGGVLLLLAVLAMALAPAPTIGAHAERDSASPAVRVVDAHADHAVMPSVRAAVSTVRDRTVVRLLRLVTFVAALVAFALGLAGLLSDYRERRGLAPPRLAFASGVSRRGPPSVH